MRSFLPKTLLLISLVALSSTSCSVDDIQTQNANHGANGSRSNFASISIPMPSKISPYIGSDKINALYMKITPSNCDSGVVGTKIEKATDSLDKIESALANEKLRAGCAYTLSLSLGKNLQNGVLEKIYLTNDMEKYRTEITKDQTKQTKILASVLLYPTAEGKTDLNLPWEAINGSPGGTPSTGLNWKIVLMASDQGNQGSWIKAFDNARNSIRKFFVGKGVSEEKITELSLHPEAQNAKVKETSTENFTAAVKALKATSNDACLIHMTSHGSQDGFNIGYDRLSPSELDSALTAGCGDRPTVVLVSACFSGLYVLDSSGVKKPNRIILTAARHDRTSFGCGTENEYTYWDSCLIDTLPKATKFKDLAQKIETCIIAKEGGQTASFPQAFIGKDVEDLDLPAAH